MEVFIKILKEHVSHFAGDFAPRLLGAIVALTLGLWFVGLIMTPITKAMDRTKVDVTLSRFFRATVALSFKAVLFIVVAGIMGVDTTSFAALLGAAGVAIGLAFQGSLSNLAGGVLLLFFRPFKVGDLIEAQGGMGFVQELSLFVTVIETAQKKTIIIPNGALSNGNIINYSTAGAVRADIPFGIQYGADIERAKEIVLGVLDASDKVLKEPGSSVYVSELGPNGVQLMALPHCKVENYWEVYWGLRQDIVEALGAGGYAAPYQQIIVNQA